MVLQEADQSPVTIEAENIGGIDETSVTITPGVTLLVGRNATNRTSLLQAIMAALGSDNVSIKSDADEAAVELTVGGETFTRQLIRRSGSVSTQGEPYLNDATPADLFAFLLESNEARRAVSRGDDLRELIMRPIDTDAIEDEIDRLLEERRALEAKLEELQSLQVKLPDLDEERNRLERQLEEKTSELAAKEAELDEADADLETSREENDALEARLEELRDKRSELDEIRYSLETERESLDHLEDERAELQAEAERLPEAPAGEIDEVESRIRRLRDRKQRIETEVSELQSVIGFNEEMVADGDDTVAVLDPAEDADGAVTDRLVADGEVTCWTCGSNVDGEQIRATIKRLRDLSKRKLGDADELDDEIAELQTKRRELEESQDERDRIDNRLSQLDDEIEASKDTIQRLEERREDVTADIESAETEIEDLEQGAYDQILGLHRETNQLKYEIGKLENELERVQDNISAIESRLDKRDEIETQRQAVQADLEELRTEIERIERASVDRFNEQMDEVLELLGYDNVERIWIERVEREGREGRRSVTEHVFNLNVIRSTESGTSYADSVSNLSESEREVTSLVFALAGYLAHEVHESVPFMLLDSLEAMDSQRLASFIDYLAEYAEHTVVALLPEDAAALDGDYQRITEI